MKDGVREGLQIKCKTEEEFVSEQEEATFWEKKLLGTTSAKSLLNTIYFYNGKVQVFWVAWERSQKYCE